MYKEQIGNINFEKALDESSLVSVADSKGNIIHANKKFCQVSGFSRGELLGQNHRVLNSRFHSKEFWADMYSTVHSGKNWNNEVKNQRKDGSFYWVDSFIFPIFNDAEAFDGYISVRNDITEQKEAQIKIEKQKQELEKKLELAQEFELRQTSSNRHFELSKIMLLMLGLIFVALGIAYTIVREEYVFHSWTNSIFMMVGGFLQYLGVKSDSMSGQNKEK